MRFFAAWQMHQQAKIRHKQSSFLFFRGHVKRAIKDNSLELVWGVVSERIEALNSSSGASVQQSVGFKSRL